MMAAVIFIFSAAALLQFFISYCRSLIAASSKQVLSAEVKDVTGIQRFASGDDFKRVMQLLQLCPEPFDARLDGIGTRTVRLLRRGRPGAPHLLQPGHARTANGRLRLRFLAPCLTCCLFRYTPSPFSV